MKSRILLVRGGLIAVTVLNVGLFLGGTPAGSKPLRGADPKEGPKSHWAEELAKLNEEELKELANDPVFKDLKAKMPQVKLGNKIYFVVERDLHMDEEGLMVYAQQRKIQRQRYKLAKKGISLEPSATGVTVALYKGEPVLWKIDNNTKRAELKYCFVTGTFTAAELVRAKTAMAVAAKSWSETCAVDFAHAANLDVNTLGHDAEPPAGATFAVRKQTIGNDVIALAFFPYWPKHMRHLYLDDSWFALPETPTSANPITGVGVLRHELGHVLGFRHEQIRSEAPPDCPKAAPVGEENFAPLSAYDPQSVMHYPCAKFKNWPTDLTAADKEVARRCYGSPPGAGAGSAIPSGPTLPKPIPAKP